MNKTGLTWGLVLLSVSILASGCGPSPEEIERRKKEREANFAKQIEEIKKDNERIVAPAWYLRNVTIVEWPNASFDGYAFRLSYAHWGILLLGLFLYPLYATIAVHIESIVPSYDDKGPVWIGLVTVMFIGPEVVAVVLRIVLWLVLNATMGDNYIPQGFIALCLHSTLLVVVPFALYFSANPLPSLPRPWATSTASSYPTAPANPRPRRRKKRRFAWVAIRAAIVALVTAVAAQLAGWLGGVIGAVLSAVFVSMFNFDGASSDQEHEEPTGDPNSGSPGPS